MLQAEDSVPLFPFFPTLLFFQANKGTDRIKAPGVTFQSDYIGPFTYRNFPRLKIKESTVLSTKTFPLQTSPLHRMTIPVSPQVLTGTQVTTDTPKSVPFFPHQVWMRKTTLVCHFSLGPSLPMVLLILCRDEISRIHTKHTKMSSANVTTGRKRQAESSSSENLAQLLGTSCISLILTDLSSGTPCFLK